MTKYFVDSEFIDTGDKIDLISIGLVCEDGREIYMQSVDFDPTKASEWVKENVLSHLIHCGRTLQTPGDRDRDYHARQGGQCTFTEPARAITGLRGVKMADAWIIGAYAECPWRTREQIRNEVKAFCNPEQYGKPEFIGWCCSYDHVALCQLFGTMMDLPAGWPHYMRDLQHVLDDRSITDELLPEQDEQLHNALADAKHIKRIWQFLETWHQRGVEV